MLGKTSLYSTDVSGNDKHILLVYKKCHVCHLLPFAIVGQCTFAILRHVLYVCVLQLTPGCAKYWSSVCLHALMSSPLTVSLVALHLHKRKSVDNYYLTHLKQKYLKRLSMIRYCNDWSNKCTRYLRLGYTWYVECIKPNHTVVNWFRMVQQVHMNENGKIIKKKSYL